MLQERNLAVPNAFGRRVVYIKCSCKLFTLVILFYFTVCEPPEIPKNCKQVENADLCPGTCSDVRGETDCALAEMACDNKTCVCPSGAVRDTNGKCVKKSECSCRDPVTKELVSPGSIIKKDSCTEWYVHHGPLKSRSCHDTNFLDAGGGASDDKVGIRTTIGFGCQRERLLVHDEHNKQ